MVPQSYMAPPSIGKVLTKPNKAWEKSMYTGGALANIM